MRLHLFVATAAIVILVTRLLDAAEPIPHRSSNVAFTKRTLTDKYYCDGVNTGDFNRDGKPDIVAGPFWYEGPSFTNAHEFYAAKEFPLPPSPTRGPGWPSPTARRCVRPTRPRSGSSAGACPTSSAATCCPA